MSKSNRELILNTAQKLFLSNGYHGTSIRMIAEKAKVSLGGIYALYKNKESIFVELLKTRIPFVHLADIVEKHKNKTAADFFKNVAKDWLKYLEINNIRILFIEWVEFSGSNAKKLIPEIYKTTIENVTKVLNDKIKRKEIRPYEPSVIMRSFIQMLTIFAVTDEIFAGVISVENPIDDIVDIYLHGILA